MARVRCRTPIVMYTRKDEKRIEIRRSGTSIMKRTYNIYSYGRFIRSCLVEIVPSGITFRANQNQFLTLYDRIDRFTFIRKPEQ